VRTEELVEVLFEEIDKYATRRAVVVDDEASAAAGAQWLAEIEAQNAGEMTPERMAALEKAKAAESDGGEDVLAAAGVEGADGAEGSRALDEDASPVAGRRFTRT
jgi:(E)-4-hydroxy-3-methylbut-2-enyl-diphosphate synthase